MEVLPIANLYSTVVVGAGSWIAPARRKAPRKRGKSEKELVLPSMVGRWKTGNERKAFSEVEKPPTLSLWMRSEDKESVKKERIRFD